jgi:hypothetical protein
MFKAPFPPRLLLPACFLRNNPGGGRQGAEAGCKPKIFRMVYQEVQIQCDGHIVLIEKSLFLDSLRLQLAFGYLTFKNSFATWIAISFS